MSNNLHLRGEIEKVLWKHYDPESSISIEEAMDEIMPLLTADRERLIKEVERINETTQDTFVAEEVLTLLREGLK